ncbi:hypothetical protein AB7714_00320 [Tardiphaga sp. 1201_B9_N1_1]|uniref:hypothetical protein n=1 Tax=unclassified Tardiphaga TaxID=2631404 RepID=UPI003F21AEB0
MAKLNVAWITVYLVAAGLFLIATKRIKAPALFKVLRSYARPKYKGALSSIQPDNGHCFTAPVPGSLLSDAESISSLVVTEEGTQLPVAHASHSEIREAGNGRFSHWGAVVYFSASDNTDPRSNGRTYAVQEA